MRATLLTLLLCVAGCSNVMVVTGELSTEQGILIIKAKPKPAPPEIAAP
jgi:hypothetical protein